MRIASGTVQCGWAQLTVACLCSGADLAERVEEVAAVYDLADRCLHMAPQVPSRICLSLVGSLCSDVAAAKHA